MKHYSTKAPSTKRKKLIFGVSMSSFIAALLLVSVTLAFLFSITDDKKNVFIPGRVDCEVTEEFDGLTKSSIKVQNTGNTKAYIRVHFVSYYQNTSGGVIGQTAAVPSFDLGSDWTLAADGYYYYKFPVAPGDMTGEMLATPMVLNQQIGSDGSVVSNQVVEVFAEAIQASPKEAVVSSWEGVAAVTGTDDHLVLKIKVYDNYANSTKYTARYRSLSGTVDDSVESAVWGDYHTGILNNGTTDFNDVLTITSPTGGQIILNFYLVNVVELDKVAAYITDDSNIESIDIYAADVELNSEILTDQYRVGTMVKSTVSGNYATDIESLRQIEYTVDVNTTHNNQFVGFVINTNNGSETVSMSEVRVLGYMSNRNIASAAVYKGGSNTETVVQDSTVDTGADFTSWTEYHSGRLNDMTRSSAVYDEKSQEKVMVRSTDSTTDTMHIVYQLSEPALINYVETYAGALGIYDGSPAYGAPLLEAVGDNPISAINVYVSETEDQADWQLLGTDSVGVNDGAPYLRIYSAGDCELYGQYVIIEIKGAPGQMYFGFNEVQIWSNALLDIDEAES